MHSRLRSPHPFRLVSNRLRTIRVTPLQKPHEKDGVIVHGAPQPHLLAGLFVPLQIASLDKKLFFAIPAGYFDGIQTCWWKSRVPMHPWPPQLGTAGQEPFARPRKLLKTSNLLKCRGFLDVLLRDTALGSVQLRCTTRCRESEGRSRNQKLARKCNETGGYPRAGPPSPSCCRGSSPGSDARSFRS